MPENQCEQLFAVPEWITAEFMQDKLRKYYGDDKLKLLNMDMRPASAQGDNYVALITRIRVEFVNGKQETQKASYLAKYTFDESDPSVAVFNEYGLYKRELDMYDIVLPKLSQLLHEIGETEKMYANAIYVDYDRSAIIFEDLCELQYVSVNRIERLDMEHAKLTLKKLAKYHAAAAVLSERSPGIFSQNYDTGFFGRKAKGYTPIMQGMTRALIRYVKKQPHLRNKYATKLEAVCENIMEYGARTFDINDQHFMTLTHGDIWTTNVMYRYEDASQQKPVDVIAIDYQFSSWGSPAIDLHYFFNSSLKEELRLQKQPELVQYYYYNLADALKKLKFKGHIPSLFDFQLQFQARYFLAFFTGLLFQPVMIYNGPEVPSFNKILHENEESIRLKDSFYDDKTVQKNIERLLPILDAKGLLDNMD